MKALLNKELHLAIHPTVIIFLLFSAMLMIPGYPYYVAFFYTTLGIFFMCLAGRENHDMEFSALLPVAKRDIVSARILFCVLIELVQLAIAVPFAVLRALLVKVPNSAGMEANTVLFAMVLVMYGLFNLVFFTRYYAHPGKVGGAFVRGSIVTFLFIAVAESAVHAVPYVRDTLDTQDPQNMTVKLVLLCVGAALFTVLTLIAKRKSQTSFEKLDL